jgi:SPFH domain / Band 7 family
VSWIRLTAVRHDSVADRLAPQTASHSIQKSNAMIAAYIIKQYERAVVFKLGKVNDEPRGPGLIFVAPFAQRIRRVSLRIVTTPIQ